MSGICIAHNRMACRLLALHHATNAGTHLHKRSGESKTKRRKERREKGQGEQREE